MQTRTIACVALVTSALLLGCEQSRERTSSIIAPTTTVNPPVVTASDPSLPPADAASRSPKTGSDATRDTALTPKERDEAMPLPGQANDHSSPEFAKKGDDKSPLKTNN
jgi:hypothetical protein